MLGVNLDCCNVLIFFGVRRSNHSGRSHRQVTATSCPYYVAGFVQVHVVANRQCLMKFLAPVDPSIEYTTNKCFRLTATRSRWALKGLFQENRMV
jgi:hypothetical protein